MRASRVVGIAVVMTVWSGAARASGHEVSVLATGLQVMAALTASLPWMVSWGLLCQKASVGVWSWGMLTSGLAVAIVVFSELPPQALYLCIALLPAAAHIFKRVRAVRRAGGVEHGDGKPESG